jgi:uncharacterized protein (TIGR00290 family)
MAHALMTSGGKDSTLALDRALRQGLDVTLLANIYEGSTNRVRFHGVRRELIARQAGALGMELVTAHTHPDSFEPVFLDLIGRLRQRGVTGIVFGNIHLAEVRAWYEERVRAADLEHIEPLWGDPPAELAREFVDRGFHAIVVSADKALGAADLVGRDFDAETLAILAARPGIDPCGERGEYHTYVYDGPIFHEPVPPVPGKMVEIEGHQFVELQ